MFGPAIGRRRRMRGRLCPARGISEGPVRFAVTVAMSCHSGMKRLFSGTTVTARSLPGEMEGALSEDPWIVSPSQAGYSTTLRRTARPRFSRWPNRLSVSYRATVFTSFQSTRPFGLDDGPRCGSRARQTPGSAGQDFFLPLLQRCWAGYHHGALQEAHCLGLWVKRGSH